MNAVKLVVVLAVICAVAAFILGITYNKTKPLIAAQQEKQRQTALQKALPGADDYKKKPYGDNEYYECYKTGKLLGYVIPAEGDGYAGPIDMLVGIDPKGNITGLEVLSQQETPGLGARCVEIKRGQKSPWFLAQFKGKTAADLNLKNIQAITGSTITSEAIIKGVKESVASFLKSIKD